MDNKHPLANCERCPYAARPFVASELHTNAAYTIVGESPGKDEAFFSRKPFTGPSGDLLWQTLAQVGVTREQCNVLNVIACAPPEVDAGEKTQTFAPRGQYDIEQEKVLKSAQVISDEKAQAALCCAGRVADELREARSNVLLLGRIAQQALVPDLEGAINTQLGRWIERDGRSYIYTYHPAYILRAPSEARTFTNGVQKYVCVKPGVKLPAPGDPLMLSAPDLLTYFCSVWEQTRALQICIDLETDQIDWQHDDILCMGIYDGKAAYVVPKSAFDAVKYHNDLQWYKALRRFFEIDCEWILQNGKFDLRFLRGQYGLPAKCTFDTMLAHYAWDERKGTHDLKGLCSFFFDVEDWELQMKDWIGTSRAHNVRYSVIPADNLHTYVAQDVFYDWHLKQGLQQLLKREELLEWPLLNLLMPANEMLLEAELHGALVDVGALNNLNEEWSMWQEDVKDEIYTMKMVGSRILQAHSKWLDMCTTCSN